MDISFGAPYPMSALSNLAHHPFVFGGVECQSMEGLLQAFKFPKRKRQLELIALTGLDAKYAGRAGNGWIKTQTLYWNEKPYDRHGPEYQFLLSAAYTSLAANREFRDALVATVGRPLTHRIGGEDMRHTILTQDEFIWHLVSVRSVLTGRLF